MVANRTTQENPSLGRVVRCQGKLWQGKSQGFLLVVGFVVFNYSILLINTDHP